MTAPRNKHTASAGTEAPKITPVLVLSTGRCGSTLLSELFRLHPLVLSVSEFFSTLGNRAFARSRATGDWIWNLYSAPWQRASVVTNEAVKEILYPVKSDAARFSWSTLPAIMATTLPHLTPEYESLFDELEPVVRSQPLQSPGDHYRFLFDWLCRRFQRRVWIERGGGSLLMASRLIRCFPDARVIHLYRDGRDTALSMSGHPHFKMLAATHRSRTGPIALARQALRSLDRFDRVAYVLRQAAWRIAPTDRLAASEVTLADYGRAWSRMIVQGQAVLEKLSPERVLAVRYELLVSYPQSELRRIIQFVSPDLIDEDWIAAASAIPRVTQSRFEELDEEKQQVLTEACKPGLDLLGYSA